MRDFKGRANIRCKNKIFKFFYMIHIKIYLMKVNHMLIQYIFNIIIEPKSSGARRKIILLFFSQRDIYQLVHSSQKPKMFTKKKI